MMKIHRLVLPIVLGIALAIALLSAAVHQSHAALEPKPGPLSPLPPSALLTREADSPQATIRYVATSGADTGACTDSANPCRTVQYAVDRAVEGDEVRVAGGVYSDIHIRPRQDITTTGYVTQVVYISKTISIQGGYTLTNWIIPDPDTNPTVLDAQGQGRVVYISGRVSPTIEGIVITGGDANNQGGWYIPGLMTDQDVGGGFYIITASATISNCEISLNSSPDYGGGAVLVYSSVRLLRNNINTNNASAGGGIASFLGYNSVISNTISNNTGGGMYLGGEYGLQVGNEQVVRNLFTENSGSLGAGILLWYAPPATLSENILNDNFADQGGGIYSFYSDPILSGNRILANQANSGGGLYLLQYYGVMDSNVVASNTADSTGGLYLDGGAPIITNNIFTRNHSESYGSGMSIDISHSARLMNNTIANNTGGYGMGITVMSNSQIVLTNTIITSQSIGIFVAGGSNQNAVFMEGTLWGSGAWANGQDWAGGGPIYTGTVNVWGDPGFVNPENGNYHIDHDSAARDAGVDAGVYTDIDGEPRPVGAGFDIGADELQSNTLYVATTGADSSPCTDSANPCRSVHYAVDQADEGDEVRVAAGVYSDIHIHPRQDITTTGSVTQVVYISKTISIQGGYSLTNWSIPDPIANPTVLDAQGLGRVVYITGLISPTIEGFQITGGDATGLGGYKYPYSQWEEDAGGGIYIHGATATISNLLIISNTAPHYGGGIHLSYSTATIRNNSLKQNQTTFQNQTRFGSGGGLSSYESNNTIIGNVFSSNLSVYSGGGFYQIYGEAVVRENKFFSNTVLGYGAGLYLEKINCDVTDNQIIANTALDGSGGGIYIRDSVIALKNNILHGNSLPNSNGGGGIYAESSDLYMEGNTVSKNYSFATGGILLSNTNADIVNNTIIENDSLYNAAGIMIWAIDDININIRHNTFARNRGDVGAGVLVATGLVTLTNNIIVSQTIGVYYGGDVTLEGTLWGSGAWANGQDWDGSGTIITGTVNVWGDPGFIDPYNGDYHINQSSAALDAGIDAGVYTDIDGEPRPAGAGFDIGADELQAGSNLGIRASPQPVASGGNLTYTLILTNTGAVELHALITATLPAQVAPGGSLTWSADLPAGSDPWTETVEVVVDPSYAGPLTSTLEAISLEGARKVVTNTVTAIQPVTGLAALNSSPTPLGQTTSFTATLTTGSGVLYEWDFGDGSSASGAQVSHVYPSIGIYTATVTASNAISSQTAQTIASVQELVGGLSAVSNSPTILGQPTIFTATVTAGSGLQFEWDFGDSTSGVGQFVEHTYPSSGVYTATITASNAVSTRSEPVVVIIEEAIAGLSVAASSPTLLGQATMFTATVSAGSNVSYTWDFGDGTSGSDPQTTHTYPAVGNYTATVMVSNLVSGISASTTVRVTQPDHNLYLPIIIKSVWITDQHFKDLPKNFQLLYLNRSKMFFTTEPTEF